LFRGYFTPYNEPLTKENKMPETNFNLVPVLAATAAISFVTAFRSRIALRKEREARMLLATELAAIEYHRNVLAQMIADRSIEPTEEETRKLEIAAKF
jgi:hypothetical protein